MKNTKQIHQLLQDAIEYKGDYAYDYIIKKCTEALALLPCETCNGTGKVNPTPDMSFLIYRDLRENPSPCPDCN